ncbi:MAG: serine/threonine-protein phosphatase [Chloroflexi bacterium]|nr:MAG: serine/threonine-protein phosphatase [Chloroflexota bacterium]
MNQEIQFAVVKINKYATSESGDTLEMIERPHGGISFVLADGQRSGKSAKAISNVVVRKAIQLLAEGVRDGAAARAAHDYLYTYRNGKVSATLNILSVDMATHTFVISRNSDSPAIVYTPTNGLYLLDAPSERVGIYRHTRPVITELPIETGTIVVIFTDGLRHAGSRSGSRCYDPLAAMSRMLSEGIITPMEIANRLVREAVEMDNGRPQDDISVLVTAVLPQPQDEMRRLQVQLPIK